MSFTNAARVHSAYLVLGLVPASFVTEGAGVDPSAFDGAVQSVQQLDDGAVTFYRVTLDEAYMAKEHTQHVSAELLTAVEDLSVDIVKQGVLVADGPGGPYPAQTDKQIDILIRDAGTPNVVTGRAVHLSLLTKQT